MTMRPSLVRRALAAAMLVLAQPLASEARAQEELPADLRLTMALHEGDVSAARQAIAHGAVKKAENPRALLQAALLQGKPELVRLVLEAGVKATAVAGEGESPLQMAITGSRAWEPEARVEIVRLLLDHGARATERMHLHMTTPGTALTYAAAAGYADVVELLVARGASVRERDEQGRTPLVLLAEASPMEVPLDDRLATARALVRLGADPAARDDDGRTAADVAEERGSAELASLLRDRRALASAPAAPRQRRRDASAAGIPGPATPEARLVAAVMANDVAMARQALDDGAEIDWRTEDGSTALMQAASWGRAAIVRLLLERGADVRATRRVSGANAVNAALEGMSYVALAGMGEASSGAASVRRDDALEVLRLLVARKPDLDILVKYGTSDRTPLMGAIEAGAVDAARILLDGGADPNVAAHGGVTALHHAVRRGPIERMTEEARLELVRALVAAGADVNRPLDGVRPLALARRSGYERVAAFLARSGAR